MIRILFSESIIVLSKEVTMPPFWNWSQGVHVELIDQVSYKTRFPIKVMHYQGSAGFYASIWGALPFTWAQGPWERFRLFHVIDEVGKNKEGTIGAWNFDYEDRFMLCFTDESYNRMRIISPVADVTKLDNIELENALIANFHSALDVKYAISEDILWSVFIHPLKELSEK